MQQHKATQVHITPNSNQNPEDQGVNIDDDSSKHAHPNTCKAIFGSLIQSHPELYLQ